MRFHRLGHREGGVERVAVRAAEVALVHHRVLVDDQECPGGVRPQEVVERGASAGNGRWEARVDLDARREWAGVFTSRYGTGREPELVPHVRVAPHERAGDGRPVDRQPRPPVDGCNCDEDSDGDIREAPRPAPFLPCHLSGNWKSPRRIPSDRGHRGSRRLMKIIRGEDTGISWV